MPTHLVISLGNRLLDLFDHFVELYRRRDDARINELHFGNQRFFKFSHVRLIHADLFDGFRCARIFGFEVKLRTSRCEDGQESVSKRGGRVGHGCYGRDDSLSFGKGLTCKILTVNTVSEADGVLVQLVGVGLHTGEASAKRSESTAAPLGSKSQTTPVELIEL